MNVFRLSLSSGSKDVDRWWMIDMENIIPRVVIIKASFFSIKVIVIIGFVRINKDINQPDISVPTASRLSDLVSFWFSSFVGDSGKNEEGFKKQKYTIRIEYTEVKRVARNDKVMPNSLDILERDSSKIRSFE